MEKENNEKNEADFEEISSERFVSENVNEGKERGSNFFFLIVSIFLMEYLYFLRSDSVVLNSVQFSDSHERFI